jgi:tripartite ATP-independent transporter DctM subunit
MAPLIILLGIYTGIFTPTEAAAIVVFYSLFLGLVVYRTLNHKVLWDILVETAYDAASIGLIVAAATLFGNVIIKALIPQQVLQFVTASISTPWILLLAINVFLLVVGMFLETTSAITILVPLLMPLIESIGIHPVHFGIIIVLNLMIGVLTPPFGIVLFVTSYIGKMSVAALTKALLPWILALFVALMLVSYIPEISLIVPRMAGLLSADCRVVFWAHFSRRFAPRKTGLSAPIPRICRCKSCGISAAIPCAPRGLGKS